MPISISVSHGDLEAQDQTIITSGFARHSEEHQAPAFSKSRINWLARNNEGRLIGALTADLLWDWLYVDELWVDESLRGTGLGRQLMVRAESYTTEQGCVGVWLWTQSWQAADFYQALGYQEFTRFPNFPRGHERIGFRKLLGSSVTLRQDCNS